MDGITKYPDIVDLVRPFSQILVVGPQRSGTKVGAKVLSLDLGYEYVDEMEVGVSKWPMFLKLCQTVDGFVLQAPGLTHRCHETESMPKLAVVCMWRSVEDIVASQRRIRWQWEEHELGLYNKRGSGEKISEVKYKRWEEQAATMSRAFTLDYESLSTHPAFIPSNQRIYAPSGWIDIRASRQK